MIALAETGSRVADAFRPLARDGAAIFEVQIRLQKCLRALAGTSPEYRHVFIAMSGEALAQARGRLSRAELRGVRAASRSAA